ncbi:hypothetical protein HL033_00400 [Neoehrlichia mikurensis]|uniref:Uncharacterized protein n=1 Tax=Neoehrlichia mikurensis TaxID=89586 RepID=A0A9Q9F4Q3_9RICK|nr:hypothetical protein [Neoehrlichia mikurensis]QXK92037.1 hypothetical protein IAH97_00400 [Neoehrlichia mikurensis]QXK92495.1 hypothetical protein HUN61_00400 [Neoehrlichia mikurensis]QXK93730.1 hypothetical protein HL033_00400 [Neoehrlichia mikurensis]UTO55296.1 hypothetical protein LUA82_03880 [Neoehrlichia mikurensis]UTO56216.1 hypothetical protein LUA81_03845 [Neoehrlichia mikurensis]
MPNKNSYINHNHNNKLIKGLSIDLKSGQYNNNFTLLFPNDCNYTPQSHNYKYYFRIINNSSNTWQWECRITNSNFSFKCCNNLHLSDNDIKEIIENNSIIEVTLQPKNILQISQHHIQTTSNSNISQNSVTTLYPNTQLNDIKTDKIYNIICLLPS